MPQKIIGNFKNILKKTAPEPYYAEEDGVLFCGDSLELLKRIKNASVDLIFADPPYSLKKAEWDTFKSLAVYIRFSMKWI